MNKAAAFYGLGDPETAELSRAEANLGLVQATYAQSKAGPTKEERAIAQAKVASAESTIADLEAALAKTTLVAPVDGVVNLLIAEPGEALAYLLPQRLRVASPL